MKIIINFSLALTLAIIGIGAIICFVWLKEWQALLIFATALLVGLATLYSAFYIGQSLKMSLHRDALHRSVQIIDKVTSFDLTKVRTFIYELREKEISPFELFKSVDEDKELRHAVITVLNSLEEVSIAIQTEYANEAILYKSLPFIVYKVFYTLEPYISEYRKQSNCQALYHELEILAHAWKEGKYLLTGNPVPVKYL